MARGQSTTKSESTTAIPRERRLAIDAARKQLYDLVNKMSRVRSGSDDLLKRAVEIGPRKQGGAIMLPSADAEAVLRHIADLEEQISGLEDEIEDLFLAELIEERMKTPEEDLLSLEDLAARLGRGHLLKEK